MYRSPRRPNGDRASGIAAVGTSDDPAALGDKCPDKLSYFRVALGNLGEVPGGGLISPGEKLPSLFVTQNGAHWTLPEVPVDAVILRQILTHLHPERIQRWIQSH